MKFKCLFLIIPLWVSSLLPSTAQEPIIFEHTGPVNALAFSPVDVSFIASSSADADTIITLRNLRNGTVEHLEAHTNTVDYLAFSPDGQLLASSSSKGGKTYLWDISRLQRIAFFRHGGYVTFSPDGRLFAISGQVFDVKSQRRIATFKHDLWVTCTVFSPDGRHLATIQQIKTEVKVWDIQRQQIIATLDEHGGWLNGVTFSPDGRTLARSAGQDIILWDVSNWTPLGTIWNPNTTTVKFSTDGKTLASGDLDGDVFLWSAKTGERIATLRRHKGAIRQIAFSADGTTLASSDENGIVRIQNIETALQSEEQQGIVRLIYFLPSGRAPQPDIDAKMDTLIKDAQQVYAQQMESHGFGSKTFKYETDANGKAVVHHVKGKFKDTDYHQNIGHVWEEIDEEFDTANRIYLIVTDIGSEVLGGGHCGLAHGRKTLIPASGPCFHVTIAVHELGHAFGLDHDNRRDATAKRILPYGDPMSSSFCAAEWLDAHRSFNPSLRPTTFNAPTRIEMLSFHAVSPNTIRFQFEVTDADGLHQVQFLTPGVDYYTGGLLACKQLDGVTSSTVEFVTTELTPRDKSVHLQVMDVNGNFEGSWTIFPIDITSLLPPSEVVSIPDPNLAAAIRQEIGNSITTHTLLNFVELDASNREISDLTGLEHAHNLKHLGLSSNNIAVLDISPLTGLTQLTSLNLRDNTISDISPLAKLTQLTHLDLTWNNISDISPLAKLTQLTHLDLYDTAISDISPLAELTQLTDLTLYDNAISDISPLAELTQLTRLSLGYNSISDISPLAKLTQLTRLNLRSNNISDISPLAELKKLTNLYLDGNSISDISPLAELKKLTYLNLYNNTISDVSPIVGLNLTGPEWSRVGLNIQRNPLSDASINTHIPAMRAKGIVVVFEGSTVLTQGAGEKIVGPWLWVIAPTGNPGAGAAASGIDFLSEMSGGSVTESEVATNGATAGTPVGDSVWTLHRLSPTGSDNIGQMVNAAGLGTSDINYHVAYGSIALDAPTEQQTKMFAGSDDAVKVWLNGELVHNNPVNRRARDFQDQFPVTLKKGTNILLVAVYEFRGDWSGFFGFASDAEYTLILPSSPRPAWDVNEDGIVDATDVSLVIAALGQKPPENPRLDVNGDGVVDAKDLALVAEHLGEGEAPAAASYLAQNVGNRSSLLPVRALPLGFTLENVERTLNTLRTADDGTLTFKRGIENLEQLLALFVPENTALLHNYPNPFNPETWIPYQLSTSAVVTLCIYAVNGAVVRTLDLGHQPAGVYRIRSRAAYWDGRNAVGEPVASGLYFYTLTAGDFSATRKMLIRK